MPQLRFMDRALRRIAALCTLAVGCVLFGAILLGATPHRTAFRLATVDPADGEVLRAPPHRVTLTFTRPVSARDSTATLGTRRLPVSQPPGDPDALVIDMTEAEHGMHGRVRVNWWSARSDGKGGVTGAASFWVGARPSAASSSGFSTTTYFNAAAVTIIGAGLVALLTLTSLRTRAK